MSENRDLSEAEETSRSYSTSEIVLAFPVEDSAPIIEPQDVFAFLPVRRMGFNVSGSIHRYLSRGLFTEI
jgi:hypothetical protein